MFAFFLRFLSRPGVVSTSVAVVFAASPTTALPADTQLGDVVVTATRTDASSDEVPATVTTIDRREIDRRLPRDASDAPKDEPDVATPRDVRRHGALRFNIRGIDDDRIWGRDSATGEVISGSAPAGAEKGDRTKDVRQPNAQTADVISDTHQGWVELPRLNRARIGGVALADK